MAKDKVGTNRGQWYVECGRLASGKQQRFYLGRTVDVSEDEARVRRHRVREYWRDLNADTWTEETVDIAKGIGKGGTTIVYPSASGRSQERHDIATGRVDALVIPRDIGKIVRGTVGSDEQLHDWLTRFAEHAKTTKLTFDEDAGVNTVTEWGHRFARQINDLKPAIKDIPLKQFGFAAIEGVVMHFANRPISAKTGKPFAVKYATSLIKAFKQFVKWLPKQTNWKKPEDWEDAFRARPKKNNAEKAAKAIGKVDAYSVDQIQVIYRYATPFERALFLLSLNCGFGAAEITGLRDRDCHITTGDSFIKRVRLKNEEGVYGEHWLFPETAEAVEWSRNRTASILARPLSGTDRVVVRANGEPLVKLTKVGNRSNKVANAWQRLTDRIQQDHPDFPSLSFGKMRKTAANMLKKIGGADGEIVAVFHQRSSAVETDDEAEVYSDREYEKVFAAQRKVHQHLRPMFAAVTLPFERATKMITSHSVTDRIKQLWLDGDKPETIAKKTGTSRATVYRYRPITEPVEAGLL